MNPFRASGFTDHFPEHFIYSIDIKPEPTLNTLSLSLSITVPVQSAPRRDGLVITSLVRLALTAPRPGTESSTPRERHVTDVLSVPY